MQPALLVSEAGCIHSQLQHIPGAETSILFCCIFSCQYKQGALHYFHIQIETLMLTILQQSVFFLPQVQEADGPIVASQRRRQHGQQRWLRVHHVAGSTRFSDDERRGSFGHLTEYARLRMAA
jgi:hypothetical protein